MSQGSPLSPKTIEELLAACREEAQAIVARHELWPEESVRVVSDAILVTVAAGGSGGGLKRRFLEAIEEGCRQAVADRDLEEEVERGVIH